MGASVDPVTTEQLLADFKVVVTDAEALLLATANQGGEEMAKLRAKTEDSIRIVKDRISAEQQALIEKTRAAARATDAFVHDNPWTAIGVGASVGLVLGLLGRRG